MIIDISPLIHEDLAVWPGDVSFQRQWQCKISEGANIDLSSMNTTVHLGAHGDAPSHYHQDGKSIDQVDLEPYLGPCYVIDIAIERGELITINHMPTESSWKSYPRILFKTGTFPDVSSFNEDFAAVSPELIDYLADEGVSLVGVDTPSFDPFVSKDLPAHTRLYHRNLRNLEGLVLKDVKEGPWDLVALPLKLKGFDASPVRAVLRPL